MSSRIDSYNARSTSVSYPWPKEVTGIERIALAAQGDLQRVLSAFFASPIVIALVYSHTTRKPSPHSLFEPVNQPTSDIIQSASPDTPIVQTRQVHLQCNGKIVCTATSTVHITSPEVAHLFLQEKYPVGQMFRRLEKVPAFELLSVGFGAVQDTKESSTASSFSGSPSKQLWRKYTLSIPHFKCEILEVFPDRQMFTHCERWFNDFQPDTSLTVPELVALKPQGDINSAVNTGLKVVVAVVFLLMAIFESLRFFDGKAFC